MMMDNLPDGVSKSDIDRCVNPLDYEPPEELWELIDPDVQMNLYADFFRDECGDLGGILCDHQESANESYNAQSLGQSIKAAWKKYRDEAVERLRSAGQIKER
jgi:hypothetical protein